MTETVNRKIDVAIEPSVGDVAKLIWSMDVEEFIDDLHEYLDKQDLTEVRIRNENRKNRNIY